MPNKPVPLLGFAFNDVLNELHQLVFEGVPGESPPFELTLLEREYIAYLLACYYQCEHCLAYAVGIARNDKSLMNEAFASISEAIDDNDRLRGVIRDIDGVVIFMKAATSKNRSDSTIIANLKTRGIEDL